MDKNTDFYWTALTYRYGHIEGFAWDFYLCEDGVLECVGTRHDLGIGVEVTGHQFQRCIGFEKELLEFVAYNKATASWQGDWRNEVPMTEAEANAILAKYPRIDQGNHMRSSCSLASWSFAWLYDIIGSGFRQVCQPLLSLSMKANTFTFGIR